MLAAAAARGAIACGGGVSGVGDGTSGSIPSTGSDPNLGTTVPDEENQNQNQKRKDAGVIDASRDVAVDASTDVTTDRIISSCENGQVDPDPSYCCKDGDPGCNSGGGGDALCSLDCREVCAQNAKSAPAGMTWCFYSASSPPKVQYYCGACGVGRIPDGTASCARGATVAERLAMQAYYESASVIAFGRLARVLEREGAPRSLVRRVKAAAREERRHAQLFSELAEARGAVVPLPAIAAATDSLLALALENAREGCVRETYGALVALHQADHARDAELRRAFAAIADDEIAHAELSWDLARFFETRLDEAERAAVDRARAEAIALLADAATTEHDDIDADLGVPTPWIARTLFEDLFRRMQTRAA